MTYPRDIFTTPQSVGKLAALESRLRSLERLSWGGRQKYGSQITTSTPIETSIYGLNPIFPPVPVYVPEGAWVALSSQIEFDIDSSSGMPAPLYSTVWGAFFELTDAADPFYTGEQVYYTYRAGNAARGDVEQRPSYNGTDFRLDSNPGSELGELRNAAMLYRPEVSGEKIYTLDFKRTLQGFTANDYVKVAWASFSVEVR